MSSIAWWDDRGRKAQTCRCQRGWATRSSVPPETRGMLSVAGHPWERRSAGIDASLLNSPPCRPISSSPGGPAGSPFESPYGPPHVSSALENSEHSVVGSPTSPGERCGKTNRPITRSGELPTWCSTTLTGAVFPICLQCPSGWFNSLSGLSKTHRCHSV